jgi:putative endonuclease
MVKFYVYIISNKHHTTLYTGFTGDLVRRIYEHRHKLFKGFTSKYNCEKLLYFEEFACAEDATHRERQLKRYKRNWKENLITEMNPEWRDLSEDFKI